MAQVQINQLTNTATTLDTTDYIMVDEDTGSGVYVSKKIAGSRFVKSDTLDIKCKKFTGTTAAAEGGSTGVNHSLTAAKIIGYSLMIEYATDTFITESHQLFAGYQAGVVITSTQLLVQNHNTNSENILSKPFRILVWYEA